MHGHPTLGVKNAKPRLSSRPGPQIGKLSEEYLTVRNAQMRTKNLASRDATRRTPWRADRKAPWSNRQAAFLLVALRQAILNVPQTWCRQADGRK